MVYFIPLCLGGPCIITFSPVANIGDHHPLRENYKNSVLNFRAEIFEFFRSYFWQCDNFIFSFWNFLTFSEDIMFILKNNIWAFKKCLLTMFYLLLFILQYFYWNRSSYLEGKASGLHYMLDQTRSSHFSFSLAIYVSPPRQPTMAGSFNIRPKITLHICVLNHWKSWFIKIKLC